MLRPLTHARVANEDGDDVSIAATADGIVDYGMITGADGNEAASVVGWELQLVMEYCEQVGCSGSSCQLSKFCVCACLSTEQHTAVVGDPFLTFSRYLYTHTTLAVVCDRVLCVLPWMTGSWMTPLQICHITPPCCPSVLTLHEPCCTSTMRGWCMEI